MLNRISSMPAVVVLVAFVVCACSTPAARDTAQPITQPLSKTDGFHCDPRIPGIQIPKAASCSDETSWSYDLDAIRKSDPKKFDEIVFRQVTQSTNFGAGRFTFPKELAGHATTKEIFRSSFLSEAPQCINELVKSRDVRSVVNLYSGEIQSNIEMMQKEKKLFQGAGGLQYLQVLGYDYKFKNVPKAEIMQRIRQAVRMIANAQGNVLVHCYGGMHRTGLVFGVMQKCINHLPLEQVIADYRCHTAYESPERPGGADPQNEEVLRDFPCEELLK